MHIFILVGHGDSSLPFSPLLSFPFFRLICPNIFSPLSVPVCLHLRLSSPLRSPLSPPVISAMQLTASVLWVSAFALSFIQPHSFVWTRHHIFLPEFHVFLIIASYPLVSVFLNIFTPALWPPPCSCLLVSSTAVNIFLFFSFPS